MAKIANQILEAKRLSKSEMLVQVNEVNEEIQRIVFLLHSKLSRSLSHNFFAFSATISPNYARNPNFNQAQSSFVTSDVKLAAFSEW